MKQVTLLEISYVSPVGSRIMSGNTDIDTRRPVKAPKDRKLLVKLVEAQASEIEFKDFFFALQFCGRIEQVHFLLVHLLLSCLRDVLFISRHQHLLTSNLKFDSEEGRGYRGAEVARITLVFLF